MKDTTPILLHFGLVVKELRRERSLSQEELANRSDLHRTYITDIEHGSRNVSIKNILKIANAIGVSLHELFSRVERYSQSGLTLVSQHLPNEKLHQRNPVEILLVEDDQSYIELTLHELQKARISNPIYIVRNGEEALQFLFRGNATEHEDVQSPKVILLDLNIPLINGFDLLEHIRKNKKTKDIPVVIITSSTSEVDKERCKRLGVEVYLTKPINMTDFEEIMSKFGFHWLLLENEEIR